MRRTVKGKGNRANIIKANRDEALAQTATGRPDAEAMKAAMARLRESGRRLFEDAMMLEPRLLFDGAAAATVADAAHQQAEHGAGQGDADGAVRTVTGADATVADGTRADADVAATEAVLAALDDVAATAGEGAAADGDVLVFVDARVSEQDVLRTGLPEGAELFVIDAETDGLSQMAEILADRDNVAAIHVLSHGRPGALLLGSAVIDADDLRTRYEAELAVIRDALTEDGDLLIYACDFGAGEDGAAAVATLAAVTGADVAASDDATGSAALGGDWELEVRAGDVETQALAFEAWRHLLSSMVISASGNPVVNGNGSVGTTAVWVNAGTVDGQPIDLKATVVALNSNTLPYFGTSGDDPFFQLTGYGEATVKWEIFKGGTNQTVPVFGNVNFTIADIDGVNGQPFTRETVAPSLAGLTGYTTETPTNVQIFVSSDLVQASGTQNQNGELTSAVTFSWSDVSSWEVTYRMDLNQTGYQARFTHDGDGDVAFVNPSTTLMLQIDLDGNDSTAQGQDYAGVFSEGGGPVPVMDADMGIAQDAALGTELHEAFVILTNPRQGDRLLVDGSDAASGAVNGLNYTISENNGQIVVHFTGTGSVADYEAALKSVAFDNPLEGSALDLSDRIFEVKVRNTAAGTTSNIAQSTISMQGRDSDGDGVPDARDLDDDNDGILDVDEGQPDFSDTARLFALHGDATRISATEVQLTPEANVQAGTVMSQAPISLLEDFDFTYEIYLGTRDANGADGIAFILHNDPRGAAAIGQAGGSMGASGIQNGLYIEFDTFNNTAARGDIADDHTQLRDTDLDYADAAGSLTDPVPLPNLEDGQWHPVNVRWDAATSTLTWSIDGQVVGTYTDPDIIANRFGGSEYVYFGFSASTGGSINDQRIRNISYIGGYVDTDGDGVIDALDRDSDNDGIADLVEAGLSPSRDADGDGMIDSEVNVDGVPILANGGQGLAPRDSDGDGIANPLDLDSDNDGIPDAVEARPTAGYVSSTHDNNLANNGINDDGLYAPVDTDGDGTPDYLDTDSDDDGRSDAEESGLVPGTDADGDGIGDGVGASYADPDGSVNVPAEDLANAVPGSEEADYRRENTPPTAADDGPVALTEDVPASGNVLANDTDPDNDLLEVSGFVLDGDATIHQPGEQVEIAGVGTFTMAANGDWQFVPAPNYYGPVPGVTYTISDGRGGTDTARLAFADITPVNDAPVAVDDAAATDEDTPVSFDAAGGLVQTNDTDVENDPLALTAVNGDATAVGQAITLPSGAIVRVNADGSWSYDPNGAFEDLGEGESATDSFTYTVSDGKGGEDTATVTVTVNGVNDAPSLIADPDGSAGGQSGQFVVTFVENGDPVPLVDADAAIADAEGRIATLVVRLDGQEGDRLVLPDPLPGGITVTAANGLQLTGPGQLEVTFSAGPDTTLADWNALLHALALEPSATRPEDPDPADRTVTLEVTDSGGLVASTETLVHVMPVNDPPVVDLDADDSTAAGVDAHLSWTENAPGITVGDVDLSVSDVDDAVLRSARIELVHARPGDVLEVGALPAGLVARIDTSYVGRIVVTITGEASVADYEAAIRAVTFRNTTETPDETTREIAVSVSDGELESEVATAFIDVTAVNDPVEVRVGIADQSTHDGANDFFVLTAGNFRDLDGEPLTYALAPGAPDWLAIDTATGEITVDGAVPADASQNTNIPGGQPGSYDVTVIARDAAGTEAQDTFRLTVANLAPEAVDDASAGSEEAVQQGNVLGNDADAAPDGDALVVSAVNGDAALVGRPIALVHGTLTLNADGSWTFVPNAAANALAEGEAVVERLTYTVSDGQGAEATAALEITIAGTNDGPVVVDPVDPGVPGDPKPAGDPDAVIADVVADDGATIDPIPAGAVFADADGDDLTYTATGLPAGLAIDPATGTITGRLLPDASQGGPNGDGVYPVTVTATDPDGATATASFTLMARNVAPEAVDDASAGSEDAVQQGNVLANDVDADGDPLTVVAVEIAGIGPVTPGQPAEIPGVGVLTMQPDGHWVFEPAPDYAGPVPVVTYTMADGEGGEDTATLHLGEVAAVNDGPRVVGPIDPTRPPADPDEPLPVQTAVDGGMVTPLDVSKAFVDPDGDDLTYTATGLPAGLSMDPVTGVITGRLLPDASQGGPNGDGVYPVTVTATDPDGAARTITVVYEVRNLPPEAMTPIEDITAINGGAVEVDAAAHFADPDGDTLTFSATGLPEGLSIDPATGRITGSLPLDASARGPWTVTVTADDGNGGQAQITFVIAGEARTDITPDRFGQGNTGGGGRVTGEVTDPGTGEPGGGIGEPGGGEGTGDPALPVDEGDVEPGTPAGESLLGSAVETIEPLGETGLPGEGGIVAQVAADLARATAAASLGGEHAIARVVRWAEAAQKAAGGPAVLGADMAAEDAPAGDYRGADLALQLEGNAGDVALRSLVVGDGLLALSVDTPEAGGAEAFRVRDAAGNELPWNVRRADARTILVDIPAGREWVVLRLERLSGDRVVESWIVRVNTASGEMQVIAHERLDRQAGLAADLEQVARLEGHDETAALLGALEVAS